MNVEVPSEEEQVERSHYMSLGRIGSGAYSSPNTTEQVLPKELALMCMLPAIETSVLQGKRLQSIEKRRTKFLKHRRLAEAALADTGMTQSAVIEMCVHCLVVFFSHCPA